MRRILAATSALLVATVCIAGLPPTTSKISGDSNNVTTFNYQFPNFTGTHTGTTVSLGVNGVAGGGTGASSFTLGSVVFMGPTALMQDNPKFFWNDTSNFLGIGTAVPDTYLTVNSNAAAVPTSAATATVHIADVDGVSTTLLLDAFNVNPNINLRRAQGTAASPTNVLSGGTLGSITFSGYGATGYIVNSGAKIDSKSAEDWTDSTGAAMMTFSTRPSGSVGASTERMRIDQNGNVGIGTTGPASKLHVSGAGSGTPSTTGSTTNFSGGTFTDSNTAGSGTATNMTFNTLQIPTLAATNASVTTTNSSAFYIAGAVKAGSNETLTNSFGEFIATDTLSGSVTNGYGLEVNAPSSATNNYSAAFLGGNTGFGTSAPNSRVHVVGNTSGTPSTTGSTSNFAGGTFTDSNTAGSGTAATMTFNTISAPTLAATNASVTTTNSSSFYIAGPVKAGSNETLTNSFGEYVSTVALSGSVTNGYGLEVNAPSAASNNYSAAFMGGNTGFKTAAPKSVVDISGNISAGSYAGSTAAPSNGMIISGTVGIGTSAPVGALTVAPAPTPTATMGSLNLGEGGFAGSAGNFSGSASGTELAINATSGYAGNLVDYQVNGVSKYSVSAAGATTMATPLGTVSGGTGLSSPTAGSVLITNGASAMTAVAAGTNGNILTDNGTTWVSSAPGAATSFSESALGLGLATSVSANALTIALKQPDGSTDPTVGNPVYVPFRSSTAATGAYNRRTVSAALSVVIPSGTTIGTLNATAVYLYIYAIDNAGTVELAVSQDLFDEGSRQTTTAISGGTSAFTLYSTTARTTVPVHRIGRISITETTAGTWASNATEVSVEPYTKANILSNGTGQFHVESAFITNNGSVWAIGSQSGSWLTAVSRTSTGGGTLTIAANEFSVAPVCTCNSQGGAVLCTFQPDVNETTSAITTTSIPIKIINSTTGSGQDNAFYVMCMGAR